MKRCMHLQMLSQLQGNCTRNTARGQTAAVDQRDKDLHNFLQATKQVCDRASNHKPSNFKLGVRWQHPTSSLWPQTIDIGYQKVILASRKHASWKAFHNCVRYLTEDSIFFPQVTFKFYFCPRNTDGRKRLMKKTKRYIPILIQIFTVAR